MARSSLSGVDRRPPAAPGHDTASLGPSDTSDSGSDIAGIGDLEEGDPGLPVDVTTAADMAHPESSAEAAAAGFDTDAGGTGERRSAGGDTGSDAPDISPDRVVGVSELSATPDEFDEPLADEEPEDVADVATAAADGVEEDEADEAAPATSDSDVSPAAPRARSPKGTRKRAPRKAGAAKKR